MYFSLYDFCFYIMFKKPLHTVWLPIHCSFVFFSPKDFKVYCSFWSLWFIWNSIFVYGIMSLFICSAWLLNSHYAFIPFKTKLASRSLRQQIKPSVTIKLHLNQNGDHNTQVLQTDPATLLHLVQQLEQALEEMKTNHCRRVVRNIK